MLRNSYGLPNSSGIQLSFQRYLSFGIPDEPPCYVGQYGGRELEISHRFYLSF